MVIINKTNLGFTLIELAIVIGVLATVSLASITVFYRTIQGTNKSDTVKIVNQNSQLALDIMTRFIRSAKKVEAIGFGDCPSTASSVTLLGPDDLSVQFTLDNGRVASNGSYISDPSVAISNLQFSCFRAQGAPDSIQIDFTAAASSSANDYSTTQNYSTLINLRSYTSE